MGPSPPRQLNLKFYSSTVLSKTKNLTLDSKPSACILRFSHFWQSNGAITPYAGLSRPKVCQNMTIEEPAHDYLQHLRHECMSAKTTLYTYSSWLNSFRKWLTESGSPNADLSVPTGGMP